MTAAERRLPIQVGTVAREGIPEPIARMVYDEYARQYGASQSFERLHQRGGFGVIEALHLLCQRIVFITERTKKGVTYTEAKQRAHAWPSSPPSAPDNQAVACRSCGDTGTVHVRAADGEWDHIECRDCPKPSSTNGVQQ